MTSTSTRQDLIVLVADRAMAAAIKSILGRPTSLQIRPVALAVLIHPQRDPGVLRHAHDFLRPFVGKYEHAIAALDREGCGNEAQSREALEAEVENRLQRNGWGDRARAVVIDPELESWVWSDSPEIERVLGWAGRSPALRSWLTERGMLQEGIVKPDRPKEAVEAALRFVRRPRSSAIYQELARSVSLRRCSDPAFAKLRRTLRDWFSVETTPESEESR